MLTLLDGLRLAPIRILHIGTEDEFLAKLDGAGEIPNTDKITVDFVESEAALMDAIYNIEPTRLVVSGLFTYLAAQNRMEPQNIIRVFTGVSNAAHQITYVDDVHSELVDALIARYDKNCTAGSGSPSDSSDV